MLKIEAKGLDISGIKGIKPAHDDFVNALSTNNKEVIEELIEAVATGLLKKEDVEYLIKLTGYGTRIVICETISDLLANLPEDEDRIARIIMSYAERV
jgi:hypothetical protein